ncbi:ComEC/Rec2 family competence protein [Bifidobacterium felsineum]|uniref:Competence protein n=1 Tax=Bifidobacterium felsineum TaxID=2045440 RepID=A0A2M9HK17_9BIFI|nr:ComEC/Rec2 family competence protein [Bifidobacterium felsineum]MBT1165043.1 ComEC/Rec2 family competence protein [Bifidobacterium felsineum]PJM77154.1 competence protein [Bifidobacterium felsineum]
MSADQILREQGSRDWRLLSVAATVWFSSLASHQAFAVWAGGGMPAIIIVMMTIAVAVSLIASYLMLRGRRWWAGSLTVCCVAASVAGMSAVTADTVAWFDPVSVQSRVVDQSPIQVEGMVTTPILVSDQRSYDCQVDMRLALIQTSRGELKTSARVRAYATHDDCNVLHRGGTYRFLGMLRQAEYGRMPLWIMMNSTDDSARHTITASRAPPWHWRIITHMQQSFFRVTKRLSEQGRVLVPGLTMGVLGQDYFDAESEGISPIDGTYANMMEERFRISGIMHLMAVSGGHFVLLAALVRRICRWMLVDRRVCALLVGGAYVGLALIVFPGDSVTRALIMGIMNSAAYAMGRRPQALSALCCTVIGSIILMPDMSHSYGFALSTAAVLGIVVCANHVERVLNYAMPSVLARTMAMTISAQLFTLPIQVLMEPQLPLLSIPANLLVAPFVSLATIAGLLALSCAWCAPWLAVQLARVASVGTLIMERVSIWVGDSNVAVMPWMDGIFGAILIALTEAAMTIAFVLFSRWLRRLRIESGMPGERFGSYASHKVRISLWWKETLTMLLK